MIGDEHEVGTFAQGTLRWGYHTAAELRACTIWRHRVTKALRLTAAVARLDPMKTRQRPLAFVVLLKGGQTMEWPVTSIAASPTRVVAQLGARVGSPPAEPRQAGQEARPGPNAPPGVIWTPGPKPGPS